ncbi:MFS transporter [Xylanimonas protaetiae]|uniref:MFS transporter n=1 Tax=Xylanimonas protaetiae TaxID=2509457 RepID=A0A4P6F8E4_9MICO|nr:MFS transporter [Xylanimonas protaetiae]QAY71153.1 MFS transporter [Xylanimonas protaetiae]
MQPDETKARVTRAAWSVFAAYAAAGFAIGTLASRLPAVRAGLGLTSTQMGMVLLLWSLGSVLALPLSGTVAARLGARRSAASASVVAGLGHLTLALAVALGSAPLAVAGLFAAGIGEGTWNAATSLEGASVERRLGYPAMSRFQAGESLGMVTGSVVGALIAATGLPLFAHLGLSATVAVVTGVLSARAFLPLLDAAGEAGAPAPRRGSTVRGALAAWREPRTLMIGLVILGAALAEGSASDWTGLALVSGFQTSESVAATGVALFYGSMLVMRLAGSSLVGRLGRVATLRLCAGAVLAGLALFTFAPWLPLAMAGSVLWGMGAALGFPLGVSAASDDPYKAAMRVSVVSTIGYTAYVIGPGVIGVVAAHLGYRGALAVVAAPVVIAMVAARAARPLPPVTRRPTAAARPSRADAARRRPAPAGAR